MNYKIYLISENVVITNKKFRKKPKINTFTTFELFNKLKKEKVETLFQIVGILNNIIFVRLASFENVMEDMKKTKEVENV